MISLARICLVYSIILIFAMVALPQTSSRQQRRAPAKKVTSKSQTKLDLPAQGSPETGSSDAVQQKAEPREVETLKIDTDLVTVPVIATTIDGVYIPDLRRDEFTIQEDGTKQEVAFFATVSAPFHVVLVLDTSGSTQQKLGLIQRAAHSFVEQLQTADRVKVISFDDRVRELNEFTNDRTALKQAINKATSGQGTKLYDAFELALSSIRTIPGRKAIVLFSDGVDWRSDQATFEGTLNVLSEEGVIVYPIRYETRQETERIAREQSEQITPQLPTLSEIRTPPSGTTAPTFPSDEPDSVPTSGRPSKTGPLGLPSATEILRRRREREREIERRRDADRFPSPGETLPPGSRPRPSLPDDPSVTTSPSENTGRRPPHREDSITRLLDQLYLTADNYLRELAAKSGGRVVKADTLSSLPQAFASIAAELRTQYLVGYYPTNKARDGQYRKIKVLTTREKVIIRARPGYNPPARD